MAKVESHVCDIDGRSAEVCTVTVTCDKQTVEIDLCKRCLGTVTVKTVLAKGRKPAPKRATRQVFTKTQLPPQP